MKKILLAIYLMFIAVTTFAQIPELETWQQNTTSTGYNGIVSNVQLVQY